jgi:hypothetical protein
MIRGPYCSFNLCPFPFLWWDYYKVVANTNLPAILKIRVEFFV